MTQILAFVAMVYRRRSYSETVESPRLRGINIGILSKSKNVGEKSV